MLRGFLGLLVLSFSVTSFAVPTPLTRDQIAAHDEISGYEATDAKDMDVTLAIGFGYHLCSKPEKLPPLETAYLCPGLAPGLENFIVALKPVKTSKPTAKMWSGPVKFELEGFGVTMGYELLVSYAVVDKKTYIFIDGRVMNSTNKNPSYFRFTSYTDFSQLDSSLSYGSPIEIKAKTGEALLLSPVVAVAAYNQAAGKPKRPENK